MRIMLNIKNQLLKDRLEELCNKYDYDVCYASNFADIMLVENVYADRMDRSNFHSKFIQFGIILYLMVFGVQLLVGVTKYIEMLADWKIQVFLHVILIVNTYFLLNGEKYYNEDVGAE